MNKETLYPHEWIIQMAKPWIGGVIVLIMTIIVVSIGYIVIINVASPITSHPPQIFLISQPSVFSIFISCLPALLPLLGIICAVGFLIGTINYLNSWEKIL